MRSRRHCGFADTGVPAYQLVLVLLMHRSDAWREETQRLTTSRTFATYPGSNESLNVATRLGRSPKARQMRCTLDTGYPLSFAMPRELQWVASLGRLSNVNTMVASMCASSIVRRPRSLAPPDHLNGPGQKRRRHLPTIVSITTGFAATNANACIDPNRITTEAGASSRKPKTCRLVRALLAAYAKNGTIPGFRSAELQHSCDEALQPAEGETPTRHGFKRRWHHGAARLRRSLDVRYRVSASLS